MATTTPVKTTNLKIAKELNISFEGLSYSAKVGFLKRHDKKVLKNLNGEFRSRELSVILGPSGSGKSTLLNLLSGYKLKNISGVIKVNGSPRNQKHFRHLSSYVMQDSLLHPLLTIREAMRFSSNLKIGKEMDDVEKKIRINEILELLGLTDMKDVYTGKLSGGQQKRLSIALELVDNPLVIFFDEPTTGLDSSSSSQCLQLLKKLADSGRTIICTIHQPSALLFRMIDHIYAIADGQCIYQGSCKNLVPFLNELDLVCPESFNPADYLLEISTHDYGYQNGRLNEKIQHGMNQQYRKKLSINDKQTDQQQVLLLPKIETNPISICVKKAKFSSKLQIFDPKSYCNDSDLYSTSFLRQFHFLLIRMFLLISRNPSMSVMRILIHFVVAIGIGLIYNNVGDSAKNMMNNFRYVFYSVMFLMFTAFSSLQTTFPLELPVIKREHFNRWYSVRAYYVSLMIADIPIQVFCTVIYILITYFMTNQPLEFFRFAGFFSVNLLVCFVAQGFGMIVSTIFNVKWGCILGNMIICPFLLFSGFFVQLKHAHHLLHWLFHISFLKYALEGGVYTIFGFNRGKIECDDDEELNYCRYSYPNQLLRDIGMQDCPKNSTTNCDVYMYENQKADFSKVICILILFTVVFRCIAYFIMRYRLKN
ncbi:CLUMA_CG015200, isoform A [Clunio marinus]|uniref:CLUMA_CG015200, isoform A n=1 Tax=Clunio marinus TaxID=568069 RepID=A0A1J1IRZ3_9DIPT|nr:CLUMA_CG015200, isoform A [Clunio marinus]